MPITAFANVEMEDRDLGLDKQLSCEVQTVCNYLFIARDQQNLA